jgi:radical SAM superfamily enzyme YgiQ (UPF0313 family)
VRNVYLCQFNFRYGNNVFIPYSVGVLWAYARTAADLADSYRNAGFVFLRDDPDRIAETIRDPDVVAFSTYVWNWSMSVEVARRVKSRHPNSLIVFGGPQVPDRMDGFFEKYPFVDVAVHGEGEMTFVDILRARLHGDDGEIAGASIRRASGHSAPYLPRERIKDLDAIPSPYLEGLFEEIMQLPYSFQPIWETNRGCPYSCTFCDWGSLTVNKVKLFSMDRLHREIEWFGRHKIDLLFGADANFGIFERDLELANALADMKRETGHPAKYRVSYAKNSTERVVQIATILNDVKMDKGITLSVQSMDDVTLKTIRRTNIKIESLSHFVHEYQRKGIPTYTELILGLPGETYESFRAGIDTLLEAGVHDSLTIYNCTVLPNAQLNDPAYRAEHQIETFRVPIFLNHSTPGEDPVQEYEEMIVSTRTLSRDDWKRQFTFAWIVQACHTMNLTQVLAIYGRVAHGIRYSDFYSELIAFADERPDTLIGQELTAVRAKVEEVLAGGSWDVVLPDFLEITWSTDESSYLRITKDLPRFYRETAIFLAEHFRRHEAAPPTELVEDLIKYQQAIVVKWDRSGTDRLTLRYPIHSFYRGHLTARPSDLIRDRYAVTITDPFTFMGDKRRYARDIIWFGRKGGHFVYQDVVESKAPEPGLALAT